MRVHWVLLNVLLLALIGLAATVACQSHWTAALCTAEEASASMDADSAQLLQKTQSTAVPRERKSTRKTMSCKVRDYVVITSQVAGSDEITLVRRRHAVLMIDHGTTTVLDADGRRVVYSSVQNQESGRNYISYTAYDASQGAWIENIDVGPDGTMDMRMTEVAGRPSRVEFRIGERWLERVQRAGQNGTILDGQFMSVADARAKLGVKAVPPLPK